MHSLPLPKTITIKQLLLCLLPILLFSCSEEKEIFETETISEYLPLQVGKSITYRLDSTVFVQSGTVEETHKYQVKHTVLQEIPDNTGAKTFLIQRLLNNEMGTGNWVNNGSYRITVYDKKAENIDNNLRIVVLQAPLIQDLLWKGNSQLPEAPYSQLFDTQAGKTMHKWDFTYTNFGNETIEGQQYENLWSVEQHNEIVNIPPTEDTDIGTKEVSIEKYAKGIGLVYKYFQLYDYQGANSENPTPHYTGFGITMWMIAHD